jgi:adenine/guanine phosphoribosyltransferase-like PRPP-binding protein
MLSHKLDTPFVNISLIRALPRTEVLVVDDIADSGETLEQYKIFQTAVLHYTMQSEHIPTYYVEETPDEAWIVYPWEQKDSETIQDYLKNE